MVVVSHIQFSIVIIHHVHERLGLLFQFGLYLLLLLLVVVYIDANAKIDLFNNGLCRDREIIKIFEEMNFPYQVFTEMLQEQMKLIYLTPFYCLKPLRKNLHHMNRLYLLFQHNIKKS